MHHIAPVVNYRTERNARQFAVINACRRQGKRHFDGGGGRPETAAAISPDSSARALLMATTIASVSVESERVSIVERRDRRGAERPSVTRNHWAFSLTVPAASASNRS